MCAASTLFMCLKSVLECLTSKVFSSLATLIVCSERALFLEAQTLLLEGLLKQLLCWPLECCWCGFGLLSASEGQKIGRKLLWC